MGCLRATKSATRFLGYSLIAIVGLGFAILVTVHAVPPLGDRIVTLIAGVATAALFARFASPFRLGRVVRAGLGCALVAFVAIDVIAIQQGWADPDCQYFSPSGTCGPDWPGLALSAFSAAIGTGALIILGRIVVGRQRPSKNRE